MGRRDKNIAKNEIFGAFRGFIQSGNAKATVSSIVESTGLNRKTFYNHFSSRDELAAWGFRRDLLDALLAHYRLEELADPPCDPYGFEGLPCYSRTPAGALSLDQSEYLSCFCDVFRIHKPYYLSLLRTEFADPFCRYLVELFQGLFFEDLGYFLNGRKMPDEAKRYIAAFFAEGVVHHMTDSLSVPGDTVAWCDVEDMRPVNNLVHEAMHQLVEAYQTEKSSRYFSRMRPS